jgi:hypothetical protein
MAMFNSYVTKLPQDKSTNQGIIAIILAIMAIIAVIISQ